MRTKRRINACNLIQKISSRRGSSSIMIFFSFTVAALMMSMVILQYSHVYLTTEHTQMLADVIADGITVGADSGWGLIYSTSSKGYKDSAVKVKEKLISANTDRTGSGVSYLIEEDYDDKVSLKSSKKTGEKGIRQAYYTIQGKKINNAINVKVTGKTENILSLIEDTYSVRREATSVLNSPTGGIRIAMYAYSFSDSAEAHGRLNPAVSHRTRYVWGAGRGGAEDTSWQQYTDCSGFVSGVYKHFTDESGKRYFFTAYTGALQTVGECVYRGYSSGVDLKKLQPGDIICYWWGSSGYGDSEHVGIYFGDGYQVDCSGGSQNHSPGTMGYGVKFRKIPSAYIEVRRVIRLSGIQSKDNPKALTATQEGPKCAKRIYNALVEYGFSPAQAAGIIGCMGYESGSQSDDYCPYIVQGQSRAWSRKYTRKVDSGAISREAFIRDGTGGGGYGTPQWTGYLEDGTEISPGRKALLYDTAKDRGVSVGSTEAAIATILTEFSTTHAEAKNRIMACRSAADAAQACYHYYEGMEADNGTLSGRRSLAEKLYKKYTK